MKREAAFESAAKAVDAWLRSAPGFVLDASRTHASWTLRVRQDLLPEGKLRLSLPTGFPGEAAEVRVDPRHCLELPHVETDGRFCHGVAPSPDDYADPVQAVYRMLVQVDDLLNRSKDPAWRQAEFARESASYWAAFATLSREKATGIAKTFTLEVDVGTVSSWSTGEIETFVQGPATHRQIHRAVAAPGTDAALEIAKRHGRAYGTRVRGKAAFIRLGEDPWTPDRWPRTSQHLEHLLAIATSGAVTLAGLLAGKRGQSRCAAVVLVQGDATYAYFLAAPRGASQLRPTIVPVMVRRIDRRWALSRDQGAGPIGARSMARVLLVGCGSLGAPVAEQMARTGITELDLMDPQLLESENVGRHSLGLTSTGQSKSKALRDKIEAAVPGIRVTAQTGTISELLEASPTPLDYDLIIDCTGESAVRCALSAHRFGRCGRSHVLLAWVEPYGAAAHVVALGGTDNWPLNDPADALVNAGAWPGYTGIQLPRCGAGFHPYGVADVTSAAAFVAQRALGVLDGEVLLPGLWSYVRSKEYFGRLPVEAAPRPIVPAMGSSFCAMELERSYLDVLAAGESAP